MKKKKNFIPDNADAGSHTADAGIHICLCIATAHSCSGEINNSLADQFTNFLWGHYLHKV